MAMKLFEGNLAVQRSAKSRAESSSQGRESGKRLVRIRQIAKALLEEADSLDHDFESDERVAYYLSEIEESRKRARKIQSETTHVKKKTEAVLSKLG